MSVNLLNGYVLFPHRPDWNNRPRFRREWRTSIGDSVTGVEDRISFRHLPLRGIEFMVLPYTLEEQRKLVARLIAAKKSGLAAVPMWGRASRLAAAAIGSSVTLASETAWVWAEDDYVFFSNLAPENPEDYEVRQVLSVAGAVLTLDQALARAYDYFCWPIIFGRFSCGDLRALTSYQGSVQLAVIERDVRPEPNADLCAIILVGDGGGDSFECYIDDVPLNGLAAGTAFAGPWVDVTLFIGIQDEDPFDGYTDEVAMNGLAKGLVWAGPWVDIELYKQIAALDSFETYADDTDINNLNNGTGFTSAWVDPGLTISS